MYAVREERICELLKQFALRKEIYQSDMPKLTHLSPRNLVRHVHVLEEVGFIRLARSNEHKPGERGRGRQVWELTFYGLVAALDKILYPLGFRLEELDQVAHTHKDKWLIFQEWDYLTSDPEIKRFIYDRITFYFTFRTHGLFLKASLSEHQYFVKHKRDGLKGLATRKRDLFEQFYVVGLTLAALDLDSAFEEGAVPWWIYDECEQNREQIRLWRLAMKNPNLRRFINGQFEELHFRHELLGKFEIWLKKQV